MEIEMIVLMLLLVAAVPAGLCLAEDMKAIEVAEWEGLL